MPFCGNCGTVVPDGIKFCPECGTSFAPAAAPQNNEQIKQEGYIPQSWLDSSNPSPAADPVYSQPIQQSYQQPIQQTTPKKKGKGGLIAIIIAVVALIAGSSLLGGEKVDEQYHGRYEIVSSRIDEIEVPGVEGEWLEIDKRGMTVYLDGEEYRGTIEISGDNITYTQSGDKFFGKIIDGVVSINLSGLQNVYVREGTDEDVALATGLIPVTKDLEWWAGDWYGWWVMDNTTGAYAELEDNCWDVCATVTTYDDNTGYIEMWDEDCAADEIFANAYLNFIDGDDVRGCAESTEGQFYAQTIYGGEWYIDPVNSWVSEIENMICIVSEYTNPDDPESGFDYYIFLRPWGTSWEDVRNMDCTNMPYTDMMPLGYDSWYAPLIEAGNGMPYSFVS